MYISIWHVSNNCRCSLLWYFIVCRRKCRKYLFLRKQENQFGVKAESWFVPSRFPVSLRTSGMMRMETNTGRLIFQNSQVCNEGLWILLKPTKVTDCVAALRKVQVYSCPVIGRCSFESGFPGWERHSMFHNILLCFPVLCSEHGSKSV